MKGIPAPAKWPEARQDRAQKTTSAILDAASIVFARVGFDAATLEEIAGLAGKTRGAIYASYRDKTDLFLTLRCVMLEQTILDIRDSLEEKPNVFCQPAIETAIAPFLSSTQLRALLIEFQLFAKRHPERLRPVSRSRDAVA